MRWLRPVARRPAAWPPPRDAAGLAETLRYARQRDPIGDSAQTGLAILYLVLLATAGTTAKDVAWVMLAGCALLRFPFIYPCYTALLRQPLAWALAAWAGWRALSLLWSPDPAGGFDELGAFRTFVAPLLLWPVLDRAGLLIAALLAGVFAHNLVQLGQYLHWFGLQPAQNDRLNGFLHPIKTGAFCAAAMSWHLSAAMHWRGRRWLLAVSLGGLAAASWGLIFSGSRGPWLSAAVAVPLTGLTIAVRRPQTRRTALALAVVTLAAAAASWPMTGPYIRFRWGQAMADMRAAEGIDRDLDTDVGQRLDDWTLAWRVARLHPLVGTGGGGFDDEVRAIGRPDLGRRNHHAHDLYLHELATLGAPGLLAALAVFALAARRAWGQPAVQPYADGTPFALAGWMIGALFDCYQLNGTMSGIFGAIVAFAMAPVPAPTSSPPPHP